MTNCSHSLLLYDFQRRCITQILIQFVWRLHNMLLTIRMFRLMLSANIVTIVPGSFKRRNKSFAIHCLLWFHIQILLIHVTKFLWILKQRRGILLNLWKPVLRKIKDLNLGLRSLRFNYLSNVLLFKLRSESFIMNKLI